MPYNLDSISSGAWNVSGSWAYLSGTLSTVLIGLDLMTIPDQKIKGFVYNPDTNHYYVLVNIR